MVLTASPELHDACSDLRRRDRGSGAGLELQVAAIEGAPERLRRRPQVGPIAKRPRGCDQQHVATAAVTEPEVWPFRHTLLFAESESIAVAKVNATERVAGADEDPTVACRDDAEQGALKTAVAKADEVCDRMRFVDHEQPALGCDHALPEPGRSELRDATGIG